MKVLVFSENFGSRTLTFVYNEVVALSKHCEVLVICNSRGDAEPEKYELVIEIPFHRNKISGKLRWISWQNDWWFDQRNNAFSRALNNVISNFKPDVIHGHFAIESLKITDNIRIGNIPVIITFHGYDATQFEDKKSYCRKVTATFNRPDVFPMFVSRYIQSRAGRLGVNVSKGFLLYLGIDLSKFSRKSYPSGEPVKRFLQVSSFAPQKGHEWSVRAIRLFFDRNPDVNAEFVFAGAGDDDLEAIRSMVIASGLDRKIKFTGALTPSEVREWMEQSHYFIHHSVTGPQGETEGLPVSIMEAMAMELPVISTCHAGIPELVQDGINGMLVQEKDIESYVNKLEAVMQWGYLKMNRERVMEMCEINRHAVQLIEIYKQVISSSGSK